MPCHCEVPVTKPVQVQDQLWRRESNCHSGPQEVGATTSLSRQGWEWGPGTLPGHRSWPELQGLYFRGSDNGSGDSGDPKLTPNSSAKQSKANSQGSIWLDPALSRLEKRTGLKDSWFRKTDLISSPWQSFFSFWSSKWLEGTDYSSDSFQTIG